MNMNDKIKKLDNFKYTDKEGKTDCHLKQLPKESKITLIKIFDNINKKAKNE
tara:strand:- start:78 stop:233 length:156 start_codon:yes stop_codon:yes gene_type:complete